VPRAWVRFLGAHAELSGRMDASLRAAHGLSLREYEVLLALSEAPGGRLRRVDLASKVLLTQGGVTRLLESLEREGLSARAAYESDRRVVYAQLTPTGRRRLAAARRTHHHDIASTSPLISMRASWRRSNGLLARLPGAREERLGR
jgi:DNA-binding MarR family transcriptional regulator